MFLEERPLSDSNVDRSGQASIVGTIIYCICSKGQKKAVLPKPDFCHHPPLLAFSRKKADVARAIAAQ